MSFLNKNLYSDGLNQKGLLKVVSEQKAYYMWRPRKWRKRTSIFCGKEPPVADEAVCNRVGTILTEPGVFVQTRDVCGSGEFADEENRTQAVRGRGGLRLKVGRIKVSLYISYL